MTAGSAEHTHTVFEWNLYRFVGELAFCDSLKIACNVYVVQEVISSFSTNFNTLILIVPAVKRALVLEEFPIAVIFAAIPREDGSTAIPFPLDNTLRRESHT